MTCQGGCNPAGLLTVLWMQQSRSSVALLLILVVLLQKVSGHRGTLPSGPVGSGNSRLELPPGGKPLRQGILWTVLR